MKKSGAALMGAVGMGAVGPEMLIGLPPGRQTQQGTLVVLYLRGGADPLNTIIPYGDPLYYDLRPTISIPRRDRPDRPGVLPISRYFGFHPAMKEMAELYQQGLMAPIISAGSTHPTRSHFDAQDFMERAAPGIKSITEGWLNRYLTATQTDDDRDLRAISLQPVLPRSLRGQYHVLAVPDYGAERAMNMFEHLYSCDGARAANKELNKQSAPQPGLEKGGSNTNDVAGNQTHQLIVETGSKGIAKLRKLNSILGHDRASDPRYPGTYLARQFRDLAKLIKNDVGLEIAALDYNGWDHHAYQGGSMGTMADMLTNISKTLKAFVDDLGPHMERTMVLCMSEFGRTVKENGNNGSDHGHGGYMMAIGGPVKGGKIYGKWSGLDTKARYQGRDLPVHTDFRMVFAETLYALFGYRADQHDFFPGYKANERPVGFLDPVTTT